MVSGAEEVGHPEHANIAYRYRACPGTGGLFFTFVTIPWLQLPGQLRRGPTIPSRKAFN
jgi:hypothetical protein